MADDGRGPIRVAVSDRGLEGENRCHPPAPFAETGVADGVDAPVHPVQSPGASPSEHCVVAEPCVSELTDRRHAVLARRDRGNLGV